MSQDNLSGSLSNLSIEEHKPEVLKSTKVVKKAEEEEEEEEDTGEVLSVKLPRKGQEAPFEETKPKENEPPPKVIVHSIDVETPHSSTKSKEPVYADHGFAESASREPLVSRNPALSSEKRVEEITQHKIWEAGEAAERFPAKCYVCRFCGLSYAYMTTLKAHERVHDVEEPYRCGKCGQAFRFYSEYDYHLRSHKDQKQYKCKCGRSFSLYTDLINHKCEVDCFLDDYKDPSPEPIHAPLRESALSNRAPAQPLYRYPDSKRKHYICQYCGKSYAESRELKYHMYAHRGERAYNVRSTAYAQCLPDDKIWKSDLDYYDWD